MRFTIAWLIVLFGTAAFGDSNSSSDYSEEYSDSKVDGTTETSPIQSTTQKSAVTNNDKQATTPSEQLQAKKENDLAPDKDMAEQLLLQIKRALDEKDKIVEEKPQENSNSNSVENIDKTKENDNNPESPVESKISKDFIDMPSQEKNLEDKQETSSPNIQFDDSKTGVTSAPPQKFDQRSRKYKQIIQDVAPFLLLTQGGYERPFTRAFRDHHSIRPDSSEQSENVQQPDRTPTKRRPGTRRIVPQVAYSPSPETPYIFGQGPLINPVFDASARNMLSMNQILPSQEQNAILNHPSTAFTSYSTPSFQPQSSLSADVGSFPNFNRDPNNVGMYQTVSSNPFQTPEILFQNPHQVQQQPVLIDAGRNMHSQFQHNHLNSHPGFQTMEVSSSPNYDTIFRNPAISTPFEIPSNFYGNAPNAISPFNNPPISFLSQYPNFHNRGSSHFLQHPDMTGTQNYQQSSNLKQFDSDTSQDENKAKETIQKADEPVSRDDPLQARLGTGLQVENVADVYMRYPTVEAGYAVEENLPTKNNSEESINNSKQTIDGQTSIPSDPYRNILNSVRYNQKVNHSFVFPPELFRSVPIDFGYQRPHGGIFPQYPDRNRGIPNYPSHNFESRIPFNSLASLPQNFLSPNNQQNAPQESNEAPSCAKENNASVCFEDKEYPTNEIFYFLNSNAFLSDRLLHPEPLLKSFSFVERNNNETEENYACDVAAKLGMPLRAKNLDGIWRIIVNLEERFSQPIRMEVCKTLGSSCSYADSKIKTSCVQKYSLQRLLTWSSVRGIFSDVYKIPVACSCQIIESVEI